MNAPCTGEKATMSSGAIILVMIPVLMMIIIGNETHMGMILTDAASTANSQPTVSTAPAATTAGEAASAPGHNR